MANPTSYLRTLAQDEAIAFVASLQKVKDHLSHELHWMNEQVQQKTAQLQGIETLLSEASDLGLVSPDAGSTTDSASDLTPDSASLTVENLATATGILPEEEASDTKASETASDATTIAADVNGNGSPNHRADSDTNLDDDSDDDLDDDTASTPALAATSASPQSNGRKQSGSSKSSAKSSTASKASATKSKKTGNTKSTGQKGKAPASPDLRYLLAPEFQGKTFTDAVAEILEGVAEPLHLNDLLAEMYQDLSDSDFKRAKVSLANVLSVGTSKGRWRNVGKGLYASNAAATA